MGYQFFSSLGGTTTFDTPIINFGRAFRNELHCSLPLRYPPVSLKAMLKRRKPLLELLVERASTVFTSTPTLLRVLRLPLPHLKSHTFFLLRREHRPLTIRLCSKHTGWTKSTLHALEAVGSPLLFTTLTRLAIQLGVNMARIGVVSMLCERG